jgi:hypothetical protein
MAEGVPILDKEFPKSSSEVKIDDPNSIPVLPSASVLRMTHVDFDSYRSVGTVVV